jgi:hypothetical protein
MAEDDQCFPCGNTPIIFDMFSEEPDTFWALWGSGAECIDVVNGFDDNWKLT